MEYVNFDLLIETKQDNCYKVKALPPWSGEECLGEGLFTDATQKLLKSIDESFCDDSVADVLAGNVSKVDIELIQKVGGILYECLFHGSIRDDFNLALGKVSDDDMGLRIKLIIKPPEIAEIPWELMFHTKLGRFLSTWDKTSVTRYLDVPSLPRQLGADLPLNVLVVIPEDDGNEAERLDKTAERKIVESAFKELQDNGLVKLQFLEGTVSTTSINDKLNDDFYDIFHFIGHGCLADDYGYLKFNIEKGHKFANQNELEKLGWLRSDSFANLFNNHSSMKLVVLNSCEGAKISSTKPLAGVAPQLFRKDIPAVVAMQFPIFDDSAITFSREFYRKLCTGRQRGLLDTAMTNARNKIQIQERDGLDFATPVLLLHTVNGVIFDLKDDKSNPPPVILAAARRVQGSSGIRESNREIEDFSLLRLIRYLVVAIFQTVDETPRLKAVREARNQNLNLLREQQELATEQPKRIELEEHIKEEQRELTQIHHRLLKAAGASLGITASSFAVVLVLLLAAVFGVFNLIGIDDLFQQGLSSVTGRNSRNLESFGKDQVRVIVVDPANREIEGFPSQDTADDRRFHAGLIDALADAGAKVIALDLFFRRENKADEALAAAVERAEKKGSRVIVGVKGVTDNGQPLVAMPPNLQKPFDGKWGNIAVGIEDQLGTSLSGVHWVLRHVEVGTRNTQRAHLPDGGIPVTPSLILQAMMQSSAESSGEPPQPFFYENESPMKIKLLSKSGAVVREIPVVDDEMSFMISVPSDSAFNTVRSIYQDVYKNRNDSTFMRQNFRDKVVFVGYGVDADRRFVSGTRRKYGVEIQASVLANMLEQIYVKRVRLRYNFATILLMFLIGSFLQSRYAKPLSWGPAFESPSLKRTVRIPIGLLVATTLYFIVVYFVYRNGLYVVDMTYHIGALFAGYWLPGLSDIRKKKKQYDNARRELKNQKEIEVYNVVNAT